MAGGVKSGQTLETKNHRLVFHLASSGGSLSDDKKTHNLSGMGLDFRVLVKKSRKHAIQYHQLYKEPIPVTQLVRETAAVMQEFTQSGGVRPFGVSLLVAGFDDSGPQLFQVDPSGSYFSWKASAMGKNVSNAKTFLEKRESGVVE